MDCELSLLNSRGASAYILAEAADPSSNGDGSRLATLLTWSGPQGLR